MVSAGSRRPIDDWPASKGLRTISLFTFCKLSNHHPDPSMHLSYFPSSWNFMGSCRYLFAKMNENSAKGACFTSISHSSQDKCTLDHLIVLYQAGCMCESAHSSTGGSTDVVTLWDGLCHNPSTRYFALLSENNQSIHWADTLLLQTGGILTTNVNLYTLYNLSYSFGNWVSFPL